MLWLSFRLIQKASFLSKKIWLNNWTNLEPRFRHDDHGKDESRDEEEELDQVDDQPRPDQDPVSGARGPYQESVGDDQDDVDRDGDGKVVTRFLEWNWISFH